MRPSAYADVDLAKIGLLLILLCGAKHSISGKSIVVFIFCLYATNAVRTTNVNYVTHEVYAQKKNAVNYVRVLYVWLIVVCIMAVHCRKLPLSATFAVTKHAIPFFLFLSFFFRFDGRCKVEVHETLPIDQRVFVFCGDKIDIDWHGMPRRLGPILQIANSIPFCFTSMHSQTFTIFWHSTIALI